MKSKVAGGFGPPKHEGVRRDSSRKRSRGVNRKETAGRADTGVICLLLTAVTLAAYARAWKLGFVSVDDPGYASQNPHVLAGLSLPGIAWAFTTTAESNWHPLTWLSLMLDAAIGGTDPRIFHATNLLLHIVNTLLLFLILKKTTGFLGRSAFVAALFAVHPLHVESVAWIAERKDVLSTLFWMLTIAAHSWYAARPSFGRYGAVFASLALGLMAKPMLVTLPVVLLLLDYWPLGRWGRRGDETWIPSAKPSTSGNPEDPSAEETPSPRADRRWPYLLLEKIPGGRRWLLLLVEKVPLLALAAVSSLITLVVQRSAMSQIENLTFSKRAGNALVSYVVYMLDTVFPRHLTVLYPHPRGGIPTWQVAGAALLLTTATATAILGSRRRPYLAVGWFWYLVTLVPVIGLVQVGVQARADRYTYVPLIGLFIVVAWGAPELAQRLSRHGEGVSLARRAGKAAMPDAKGNVGELAQHQHPAAPVRAVMKGSAWRRTQEVAPVAGPHRSWALTAAAVLTVLVLAAVTWVQVGYWHDAETLMVHAVESTSDNAVASGNLGGLLLARGDLGSAISHLREALRINPQYMEAHSNLVIALMQANRSDEATALVREEQSRWPADFHTYLNLGYLAMRRKDSAAAEAHFKEALRLNPDAEYAHANLLLILAEEGRLDEASSHYSELVRIVGPERARRMAPPGIPAAR